MSWSVLCDFDGTISKLDSTDELLEKFALPQWHAIEDLWISGRISARECMRAQVELVRANLQELDAFAKTVKIEPGFARFVKFCRSINIPFTIVSDGIDYLIQRILLENGINNIPLIANRLVPLSDNTYTLESPYMEPGCQAGTCKCAIAQSENVSRCLYIGDGRSDFCVSSSINGFVIAKAPLLVHCINEDIPHTAFGGFQKAEETLARLIGSTNDIVIPARQIESNYAL